MLGLDEVRRVVDFVAPSGEAPGLAALMLAGEGVLALPPFGGAEPRDGRAHRPRLLAGLGDAGGVNSATSMAWWVASREDVADAS